MSSHGPILADGVLLVVPTDLPSPVRTWYQVLDSVPVLFVRRDLCADLADLVVSPLPT